MATKCTECKKPIEAQHGKISDGTEHGMVRHYSNSTGISLPRGPCVGVGWPGHVHSNRGPDRNHNGALG